MTYFAPVSYLKYPIGNYYALVKDITVRTKFNEDVLKHVAFFDYYTIKDSDTPEFISYAVYGTPFYHWVILLANNIVDPFFDWPIPDTIFNQWVEDKYSHLDTIVDGETHKGADKIKYWVDEYGAANAPANSSVSFVVNSQTVTVALDSLIYQGEYIYYTNDENVLVRLPDSVAVISTSGTSLYPISNRIYEEVLNSKKRQIKIIKKDLITDVVQQFEELMSK